MSTTSNNYTGIASVETVTGIVQALFDSYFKPAMKQDVNFGSPEYTLVFEESTQGPVMIDISPAIRGFSKWLVTKGKISDDDLVKGLTASMITFLVEKLKPEAVFMMAAGYQPKDFEAFMTKARRGEVSSISGLPANERDQICMYSIQFRDVETFVQHNEICIEDPDTGTVIDFKPGAHIQEIPDRKPVGDKFSDFYTRCHDIRHLYPMKPSVNRMAREIEGKIRNQLYAMLH